jgi:hypothetical protein
MQLLNASRQKGFARVLSEITRTKLNYPFARTAGAGYLFCFGINEIGNNTPANQALVRSSFSDCLTAIISKARASVVYLAATSSQWSFGANFSTSAAAAADYTSGTLTSKEATVVDSAGTSTATFKIPIGYKGEPICFNMVGLSGGSLIVTWGGTVTGTTSIVGRTDILSGIALSAQSAHPVRFTAATNGLSAANAGQTITVRITTVSGSTFTLDGCWIESLKPPPVLVCNVNRLPETSFDLAFGDGVTTGVNTSFTSASAQFLSSTDAGQAITETDAQGAFTAGKTVSSVTNATTIVLSGNATGAFTNIKCTLARRQRGYSSSTFYTTNTDFTAATIANHTAADGHVTSMNTSISNVVALFGSMVQIVDMDAAIGGDLNLPANVYSYYGGDALHPNDIGYQKLAVATWKAAAALRPENDSLPLGPLEIATSPPDYTGPDRRIIMSGQIYVPEFRVWGANYTAVAGDVFALPMFFTEPDLQWGATMVEQMNAPATSGSSIRVGIYDDCNSSGYPQNLRQEPTSGGAFALGTTAGVKNPGVFTNRNPHYGLYWLIIKIDALGTTASQLRTLTGPNRYLPNWVAAGGAKTPIAWKLTGVGAAALPTIFPSGGVIADTAPALGVTLTVL